MGAAPTNEERRVAREGARFARAAEADPLWNRITIRLRLRTPLPEGALTESVGDAAARQLYLFCAANLFGAGLLTEADAGRLKVAIESMYRGVP